MEIGYRADFPHVRHLLWVVGLDALFTSTEWGNRGTQVATGRIEDFLGGGFEIYSENRADFEFMDLDSRELPSPKRCRSMYKLRNQFAHGRSPDKAWAGKVCRRSANGLEDIYTRQSFPKQDQRFCGGSLKKFWLILLLTAMFNDKAKMNLFRSLCLKAQDPGYRLVFSVPNGSSTRNELGAARVPRRVAQHRVQQSDVCRTSLWRKRRPASPPSSCT